MAGLLGGGPGVADGSGDFAVGRVHHAVPVQVYTTGSSRRPSKGVGGVYYEAFRGYFRTFGDDLLGEGDALAS